MNDNTKSHIQSAWAGLPEGDEIVHPDGTTEFDNDSALKRQEQAGHEYDDPLDGLMAEAEADVREKTAERNRLDQELAELADEELDELTECLVGVAPENTLQPGALTSVSKSGFGLPQSNPDQNYFGIVIDLAWEKSIEPHVEECAKDKLLNSEFDFLNNDDVIDPANLTRLVDIVAANISAFRQGTLCPGRLPKEGLFWERNSKAKKLSKSQELRQNLDVYLDTVHLLFRKANQGNKTRNLKTPSRGKHDGLNLIVEGELNNDAIYEFVYDIMSIDERLTALKIKPEEQQLCHVLLNRAERDRRKKIYSLMRKVLVYTQKLLNSGEWAKRRGPKLDPYELTQQWISLNLAKYKLPLAVELEALRIGRHYNRKTASGDKAQRAHAARVKKAKDIYDKYPAPFMV